MSDVSTRYALRSLRRNLRRTILSVLGVAIGVGVGLFAISWIRGQETMTISAAASGGIGHLRVAPAGWAERRDGALRLSAWRAELARVRAARGVRTATPRARVSGLLGIGTRTAHVTLTGVDPTTEPEALRYVRELAEGRYLDEGERGAVVLGRTHARRLDARLDDELVVTVLDDEGELSSQLLTVVGVVETGSRDVDATIAHVSLEDLEVLSGRDGAAEITVLVDDVHAIDEVAASLRPRVSGGDEVLTWRETSPELRTSLESDASFYDLAITIILLVVLLGVASAQLTGVLERRKEFAVLAAVGMRGVSLVKIVVLEGVALGALAAVGALAWIGPIVWKLDRDGVDLSGMVGSDEGWALGGVLFDPMIYPDFGPWIVGVAFLLAMIATITASLYPAWFASRTDPAHALRVDR